MQIQGRLYVKDSAAHSQASLTLKGDEYHVYNNDELIESGLSDGLEFSSRIGNAERKITLVSGDVFASHQNNEVDAFIKEHKGQKSLIHMLESKMRWVVVALIVTVVSSFSFIRWGIPTITYALAESLPHSVNETISQGTLDFLDKFMFDETQVTDEQQAAITARFKTLVQSVDSNNSEVNYRLYFRSWDNVPNALALPSGEIILTDKFIELVTSQDEMDSVLLHEIGHVYHRHSLKMVIQGTIVATLVTLIAGDASGFADMGVGLGSLLVTTHYSRKHETEADHYAFTNMLKLDLDPAAFASIMRKMQAFMSEINTEQSETETPTSGNEGLENQSLDDQSLDDQSLDDQNTEAEVSGTNQDSVFDYISSHPKTKLRVEQAEKFSLCYQQGLVDCPL